MILDLLAFKLLFLSLVCPKCNQNAKGGATWKRTFTWREARDWTQLHIFKIPTHGINILKTAFNSRAKIACKKNSKIFQKKNWVNKMRVRSLVKNGQYGNVQKRICTKCYWRKLWCVKLAVFSHWMSVSKCMCECFPFECSIQSTFAFETVIF